MSMLQLNTDLNQRFVSKLSKAKSSSHNNVNSSFDNCNNNQLNKQASKYLKTSFSRIDKTSHLRNQPQFARINPANLTYQKSLLKKTSQYSRLKKTVDYEHKNVNLIKNLSKFQEQFKVQIINSNNNNININNDIQLDLNDLNNNYSEETIKLHKQKWESNNLTLVSAENILNNNNKDEIIDKKNMLANSKYCILSRHGTIRGTLNHVRDSIKHLLKANNNPVLLNGSNNKLSNKINSPSDSDPMLNDKFYSLYNFLMRDYEKEEYEQIVIYTTSLRVIRSSYDKCKKVKKILQSHQVKYEERDLYKKKIYQHELQFRLNLIQIELPAMFYNGKYIGNCDQIESYSDQGILRKLFKDLEKIKLKIHCDKCAGYRFILCKLCNGGKKKYNNFVDLKCTFCNEDGLIRCDFCAEQQLI